MATKRKQKFRKPVPLMAIRMDTGAVERFPSTMAAGRAGFDRRNIFRCDRGKQRTHHGRRWVYLV